MTLQEANETRDKLREKLDTARAGLAELDAEREALAFDAHTGDEAAEAALTAPLPQGAIAASLF
jgi:hypothetical protein